MYPTSPPSTTRRTMVVVSRRISAPPPPRVDASRKHEAGDHQNRCQECQPLLTGRHRDSSVGRLGRPDGNEAFLLREPVDRVRKEVRIAGYARVSVLRELRSPEYHNAGFGLRGIGCGCILACW